jgi:hypothetical protein
MVSVVKIAIVLGCAMEEQHSAVHFLWAEGLIAKNILTETFPVYGRKCLLHKAVHNLVKEFSQGRLKVAHYARPVCPVEIVTEATACAVGGRADLS